jgi:glutathione S-transferase
MQLTLVLGSRHLSSWSFRPWLALRQGGVAFDQVVIPLDRPDSAAEIARWSPSGKVPALLIEGVTVWDSLAICELAAELAPDLWPADPLARAHARSVAAEMHSGFPDLRAFMPMDFAARFGAPGRLLRGVARDVARIEAIWSDCRRRYAADGPFLFGSFSIADAMYAPVVSRFVTYDVAVGEVAGAYMAAMQGLPAWAEWAAAAAADSLRQPPAPSPGGQHPPVPAGIAAPPLPEVPAAIPRLPATPYAPRPRLSTPGDSAGRTRLPRPELKPIGDGIHRRR